MKFYDSSGPMGHYVKSKRDLGDAGHLHGSGHLFDSGGASSALLVGTKSGDVR